MDTTVHKAWLRVIKRKERKNQHKMEQCPFVWCYEIQMEKGYKESVKKSTASIKLDTDITASVKVWVVKEA